MLSISIAYFFSSSFFSSTFYNSFLSLNVPQLSLLLPESTRPNSFSAFLLGLSNSDNCFFPPFSLVAALNVRSATLVSFSPPDSHSTEEDLFLFFGINEAFENFFYPLFVPLFPDV
jgi:hypothetical protein